MVVMLYDEAIRQLDRAIGLLDGNTKKLDDVHNAVCKAQDIITELTVTLDLERGGDIAKTLFGLYRYFTSELFEGNIKKDPEPMKQVRGHLKELRDAWDQISEKSSGDDRPSSGGLNIAG
jgi:flagellar protein FliS